MERVEQRYCIKFGQKLGDSQVETIQKIQIVFGDDAMGTTQIKESGTAGLKMTTHQWIASYALAGLQQAEMTRSLPK